MQLVFDRHWMMVAERDGETVGVALTFPDVNQVLRQHERAPAAAGLADLPARAVAG